MGWTWYQAKNYKNGKVDRKAECDYLFNDEKFEVLKSSMVGSVHYAAVQQKDTGKVFATITLTGTNMKDYFNFGYKDMDETCGPYENKCPKAILNLLTPTDSEYAKAWRERCWEYHNSKNDKPSLCSLRVGSVVEFVANGEKYQATKTYGRAYLERAGTETKIKKIDTVWKLDHYYNKATSRCINSWGYTVVYKATKEEEQKLREERIASIRF